MEIPSNPVILSEAKNLSSCSFDVLRGSSLGFTQDRLWLFRMILKRVLPRVCSTPQGQPHGLALLQGADSMMSRDQCSGSLVFFCSFAGLLGGGVSAFFGGGVAALLGGGVAGRLCGAFGLGSEALGGGVYPLFGDGATSLVAGGV